VNKQQQTIMGLRLPAGLQGALPKKPTNQQNTNPN